LLGGEASVISQSPKVIQSWLTSMAYTHISLSLCHNLYCLILALFIWKYMYLSIHMYLLIY